MNNSSAAFLTAKNARDGRPLSYGVNAKASVNGSRTSPTNCVSSANRAEGAERLTTNPAIEADRGMTDDELETAICEAGDRFIEAAERWEKEGGFGDHAEAQKWWRIQKHLIGLRSKEWVERTEQERGLK